MVPPLTLAPENRQEQVLPSAFLLSVKSEGRHMDVFTMCRVASTPAGLVWAGLLCAPPMTCLCISSTNSDRVLSAIIRGRGGAIVNLGDIAKALFKVVCLAIRAIP